jgi:hypothetical protein
MASAGEAMQADYTYHAEVETDEDEGMEAPYVGEDQGVEEEPLDASTTADNQTLFKQVVDGLKPSQSLSSCIINTEGGGSQSGGQGGVRVDKLTILIMLAHGLIDLTPAQVALQAPHPAINVSALPNVKNLAIFGFAPTGMVNIGNLQELTTYGGMIQSEFIAMIQSTVNSSIQSIEDKIKNNREKLEVIRAPRKLPKESFFNKICNICFKAWVSLPSISETVDNYTFKNFLSVCRNILPSSIMAGGVKPVVVKPVVVKPVGVKRSGVKRSGVKPRVAKPITTSKSHSTGQTFSLGRPFSMSNDMCVLLLDDLRSSIQNFDRVRFPLICEPLRGQDFCDAAMANCMERCRKLYIVKGFGSGQLPFVNKHFQYDTSKDPALNMGVIKLKFSIDANGSVKSDRKLYDPRILMQQANAYQAGTSFWSSMQQWAQVCTDLTDETVCIVDLSCSGIVCQNPTLVELPHLQSPGGGKIIKKKSYSRKKTRRNHHTKRIKNKSKHIKRVRNKRSIRKNNTKKLRK